MSKKFLRIIGAAAISLGVSYVQATTALAQSLSFKTTQTLRHEESVTNLAWSPDGQLLVTGGLLSAQISVWDAERGKLLRQLQRVAPYGQSMAFSSEGKYLISSPAEDVLGAGLTLWDTDTWKAARYVFGPYAGLKIAYSAARKLSLSADRTFLAYVGIAAPGVPIALVDALTWETKSIVTIGSSPMTLSLSPNGNTLAVGTLRGELLLIESDGGRLIRTVPAYTGFGVGVNVISYSPDGRLLALGPTYTRSGRPTPPDPVRVFKEDGVLVASLYEPLGTVRSLDWSPDNRWLAIATSDGTVRVWAPETKASSIVTKFASEASAVQFSPDGRRLAAGGHDLAVISELR